MVPGPHGYMEFLINGFPCRKNGTYRKVQLGMVPIGFAASTAPSEGQTHIIEFYEKIQVDVHRIKLRLLQKAVRRALLAPFSPTLAAHQHPPHYIRYANIDIQHYHIECVGCQSCLSYHGKAGSVSLWAVGLRLVRLPQRSRCGGVLC
jgi:hypothetical protein